MPITGKVANSGGIANANPQQFPVLWLGTLVSQIEKALIYAEASYHITQQ